MSVICTAITKLQVSIDKYKNLLEECQLREHEAQQASQEDADVIVESYREEVGSDVSNADSPSHSNS